MAVYTCYDMIPDCKAGKSAGWDYFIKHYVRVIRKLVRHYYPQRSNDLELVNRLLVSLRKTDSGLFSGLKPVAEREFVADLRQACLAAVEEEAPSAPADIPLDLETLSSALEPLSSTERQVVWLEGMRYGPEPTADMMHMHAGTVNSVRDRAAELLRGKMDAWRRNLIANNGPGLRVAAPASREEACVPAKTFLDWLDGRITWRRREEADRRLVRCWHCIDLFCRLREAQSLLRDREPLSDEGAEPYRRILSVVSGKAALWKRMLG